MHGFIRAIARLLAMGAVMGAVLVGALVAGLGTTTAIAAGVVMTGVVGLVGVVRRPRQNSDPVAEIAAMLAASRSPSLRPDPLRGRRPDADALRRRRRLDR
jgi:hypothetical protein